MGNLARFGIAGGERVSVETLGCLPVPIETDDFSTRCIKELGFARVCEKVAARSLLDVPEIAALISRAPLSILMKLVETGVKVSSRVAPIPMVAVSLAEGGVDGGADYVAQIEHPCLEVILNGINLDGLGDGLEERISAVSSARPGLKLVGPAAEDILQWLQLSGRKSRRLSNLSLSDVVARLRAAGVERLRTCRDVAALSAVSSVGLGQSFCTALDRCADAWALAEHFAAIAQLSDHRHAVSVWFPGLSRECRNYPLSGAALDLLMLRMLAIGTICLPGIERRRASSRYLSLEAFKVAHLCGANDFGYGAIDGATEDALQLKQFGALRGVVPHQHETGPSDPQGRSPQEKGTR